jgi:hypothetical protein
VPTPLDTFQSVRGDVLGSPDVPHPANAPSDEPGYVLWPYTGPGSVFFFLPGSIEEHLVTEHGVDSLAVRRHAKSFGDHARDHARQAGIQLGAVGDLLPVDHSHEAAA